MDAGAMQTLVQEPQWLTSCGSTHVPQASVFGGVVQVTVFSSGASSEPSPPPLLPSEPLPPVSPLASPPSAIGGDESCCPCWSPPPSAVAPASSVSPVNEDPQ
jgi:hypothetical protein